MNTPTQNPSNELTPVEFEFQSHQLRIQTDDNGEPWFCAKDVCDVLGYVNPWDAVQKHCKPKGVLKREVSCDLANREVTSKARETQEMSFINEGNLYRLIIKSNKPEAEPFEAWVCDEVLPSIRKTGSYAAQPRPLPEPPAKEPGVTRLLVTMHDGERPITETLSANKFVLSLNDFTELARTSGYLVISKDELNRRLFGGEG